MHTSQRLTSKVPIGTCLFLRQTTLLLVLQADFVDKTLIYLYDCRLPFEASKSPEIFHRLTQAITQMLKQRGFTVLAYLDDFLIISDTVVQCQVAYQALTKLLRELGFQINWDKAVGPCQRLIFLGNLVPRVLSYPPYEARERQTLENACHVAPEQN